MYKILIRLLNQWEEPIAAVEVFRTFSKESAIAFQQGELWHRRFEELLKDMYPQSETRFEAVLQFTDKVVSEKIV